MVVGSDGSPITGPWQAVPAAPALGKIVPVVLQLIRSGEAPETKKVLRSPFPGSTVVEPSVLPVIFSMPLGLRFNPPPLNIKVRMEGCTKIMPKPERTTVLPVPKTSQATPILGETLL